MVVFGSEVAALPLEGCGVAELEVLGLQIRCDA
jgi:hypothetical protein